MKKMKLIITLMFLGILGLGNAQNTSFLEFDGSNDYVKYNDDMTLGLMDGASNYTMEAWIYPNSTTIVEYDRVFQRFYSFAFVLWDGKTMIS